MTIISNRRKSVKLVKILWPTFVIATILGCSSLAYVLLNFGSHGFFESTKEISPKPEKLVEENKCIPVCDSKECVEQSNMLLSRVDPTVDPCENFLEFACRKHLQRLNPDKTETGIIHLMSQMRMKLKAVLDNIQAEPDSATGKLKIVYDSCMKRASSELKTIPTVLRFLSEFGIPGWPNLQPDFKFNDSTRLSVLSHFIAYQQYGFVKFERIKNIYMLEEHINSTEIGDSENTFKCKELPWRKNLVEDILQYFDLDTETIGRIWNESEAISNAIDALFEEYDWDKVANMSDAELDCAKPQVKWKVFCELMDKFLEIVGVAGEMNKYATIYKQNFHYMETIFDRLANFSDRSVANFLVLNLLMKHLDDLNFYFRLRYQKDPNAFNEYLGIGTEIGNWQHCVDWQIKNLYIPLAHEYTKTVFTLPVIEEVEDFIGEIIREIADEVSHQKWISKPVRNTMISTIKNITLTISTIKKVITNETIINKLYEKFHPIEGNFMHNVFEYERYTNVVNMLDLKKAYGVNWFKFVSLLDPNAYVEEGNIDTDFGILLPPVYRVGLNRLMNLVSLSTIMAHEVGHILDLFHELFKMVDPIAEKKIDGTLLCLVDQYSMFKFESIGKYANGSYYTKENFADLIGISIIDKFIKKYSSTDKVSSLPGFSFSIEQQLYITAMQMWCSHHTKRDEEYNYGRTYNSYTHSLFKFRMLGQVQNSKGFAKAFNCPKESFMNPTDKCSFFHSED